MPTAVFYYEGKLVASTCALVDLNSQHKDMWQSLKQADLLLLRDPLDLSAACHVRADHKYK